MKHLTFCPVRVRILTPDQIREIRSLPEALLFMIDEWTVEKSDKWTAAVKIGLASLKKPDNIAEARNAFIEAAIAANIYVTDEAN